MKTLRWVLVVPTSIAAWYVTFAVGILGHGLIESMLCPTGAMVSGTCTDPTVQQVLEGAIVFFVALSAAAVIMSAVVVAPNHRSNVAWIAFCAGAATAVYFAMVTKMYFSGAAALLVGFATAFVIARRERKDQRHRAALVQALVV
jgi:hypothetical protein